MDVSIVIVNWNTRDILRDCLNSIYRETDEITFEVIVIDNASTDGSADMVRIEFPQTILIMNERNRGFAAANNQGMHVAKGRYVLLLNSDTVVINKAIQKTVTFADRHSDAAVIGCRVLNPDGSLQPTCFMFPSLLNLILSSSYLYKIFPESHFFGREAMTWWDRNDRRRVEVVTGCYMLVRKEAIQKIGLMDERFFMYGEETDWCYRFAQAGWCCLFTPSAEIIHLGGASTVSVLPEMIVQLERSILIFFKKHRRPLEYNLAKSLIALFLLVRIPYWITVKVVSRNNNEKATILSNAYRRAVNEIIFQ